MAEIPSEVKQAETNGANLMKTRLGTRGNMTGMRNSGPTDPQSKG